MKIRGLAHGLRGYGFAGDFQNVPYRAGGIPWLYTIIGKDTFRLTNTS
jgi:hypothetical protein